MKFEWQGDLNDDCSLRVGNLLAHVECLGDFISIDDEESILTAERTEYWDCSVSVVDERGMAAGDDLFHGAEHGGLITSGHLARAICEAIIRARLHNPGRKETAAEQCKRLGIKVKEHDPLEGLIGGY